MNLWDRLFSEVVFESELKQAYRDYNNQVQTIMNLDNKIEKLQDLIKLQQSEIEELRGKMEEKTFVIGRYNDGDSIEHKIVGNYIKRNEVYLNGESVAYFDYINYWYEEECSE